MNKLTPLTSTQYPVNAKIIGAWSSNIKCCKEYFNLISLASALPQEFPRKGQSYDAFFSKHINGKYEPTLSNGNSKYIISIGGSNASRDGWKFFFDSLIITSDTKFDRLREFVRECKSRGIIGIDLDLEGTTEHMNQQIKTMIEIIKIQMDSKFIIMLTIFLHHPHTFASILNSIHYDYLSIMLYNGGMYSGKSNGNGCDWDQWAELILSKGEMTDICKPIGMDIKTYKQSANLTMINPEKVLLSVITDTVGNKANNTTMKRVQQLIDKYGAAGIMLWVIPGWANSDNLNTIRKAGYVFDNSYWKKN
jgi:hypothetical protein